MRNCKIRNGLLSIVRLISSIALFFVCIGIFKILDWDFVVRFKYIPSFNEILKGVIYFFTMPDFYFHILISIGRVYFGFGLAACVAIPFAILVVQSNFVKNIIFPVFEIIRPIPNVAWIPLSIMLFKTINGSVLFITFIGAFFPILINSIEGLRNIDENYIKIAISFRVSKKSYIKDVMLPAASVNIYSGLLLGMSGAWLGVIVAEMISGQSGIGYLTWVNYTLVNLAHVIVCMFTIGVIGAASTWIIRMIYKKYVKKGRKE